MVSGDSLTKALVAGVDGCRAGWIYVTAEIEGKGLRLVDLNLVVTVTELIEATKDCQAISLDMPVGFSDDGWREADVQARRFIGARRSSVFPPPPRALLTAEGDYTTLNAMARQIRAGLPKQTYNILAKMREVDEAMTPELQQRIRECHPEVSFCALNGDCLRHAKRSREGQEERLELLSRVYGSKAATWRAPRGAALDDLYDAAVLAWTAARIVRGEAKALPSAPPLDARGLRMEIVY